MQCFAFAALVEVLRRGAFAGAVVGTGVEAHAEDRAEFLGAEGGEGLEGDGEVGADLETGVEDGGGAVHVGLRHLPGLHVGDVLVADAGDVHRLLQGLAEVEGLHVFLQGLLAGDDGGKGLGVNGFGFPVLRDETAEVLVREDDGAVHEVAEHGHEFGVVALLEVLPGEVVVLGLRGVRRQDVPQDVLLARELLLVLVDPDSPVAGGGDLVTLEVQELVGRDVLREDVVAVGLEHGREHDAVEDNVVLADEMHQPGLRILPPLFPTLREEFLGVGDVADGGVEPDVEDLALGTVDRDGDAPVQVAGDGAGLQAAVQPALALAIDVGLPLLVLLQDPVAEPGLVLVQREVPVLGLHLLGRGPGQGGLRIDQLFRAQRGTAFLALVPVGAGIAALGAGTHDVTVREEGLRLLVVILLGLLGDELVVVIEFAEELRRILVMHLGRRPGIDVEVDAEAREGVLHHAVVLVHDVLRSDALGAGLDGDGHAVLVGAADEDDVLAPHPEVADVDVAGDVGTGQVADMDGTVGVRKRAGHEGSLVGHLSLPNLMLIFFFRVLMRSRVVRISRWRSGPAVASSRRSDCCSDARRLS